jgi:hypothetical protein
MTSTKDQSAPHSDSYLDAHLYALRREVPLRRDLWPQIAVELTHKPKAAAITRWVVPTALAASVALVTGTFWLQSFSTRAPSTVDSSAFLQVRAELQPMFSTALANLAPATRARVLQNLDIIRNAEADISAALAEDPSNPLLLELRQQTYEHEIELMTSLPPSDSVPSSRSEI